MATYTPESYYPTGDPLDDEAILSQTNSAIDDIPEISDEELAAADTAELLRLGYINPADILDMVAEVGDLGDPAPKNL